MRTYFQNVLWLLIMFVPVSFAGAEETERTIAVSGVGSVSAVPDVAIVHAGVLTQAKDARDALNTNNATMEKIFSLLKQYGIEDKHIQTSGFNIHPEYDRSKLSTTTRDKIVGYRVNNQLQIKLKKFAIIGDVLNALVQVGSNQISGISFTHDNIEALKNEARKRAVTNANARAELYAQAAGVSLGKVISISESAAVQPVPRYQRGIDMMAAQESAVPIAAGEDEIHAKINMIYSIAE